MLRIAENSMGVYCLVVFTFACTCSRTVTRDKDDGQAPTDKADSVVDLDDSAASSTNVKKDASSDSEQSNREDGATAFIDSKEVDRAGSGSITNPNAGASGSSKWTGEAGAVSGGAGGDIGSDGNGSGSSGTPGVVIGGSSLAPEFPQLTCDDEECPNISRVGSMCCTTGNAPYSLEEDRCGTDVSRLLGLATSIPLAFDPTQCLQIYQPGEIDGFCPDLPPIVPILGSDQPGCCMQSGYCGGWETLGPLGCHAITNDASSDPIPCRLFSTPKECREVYDEHGELDSLQSCICDNCLDTILDCRRELGCYRIWSCMLESDCRTATDCYLSELSPCKEEFETYDAISLSYALEVSTCVQLNCD